MIAPVPVCFSITVGKPNSPSLASYDRQLSDLTSLVLRLCTLKSLFYLFCTMVTKFVVHSPKIGLTKLLERFRNISLSMSTCRGYAVHSLSYRKSALPRTAELNIDEKCLNSCLE